uniref:NADH-ubiquinone oxidoreductase chain 6 n=1 Tax=Rubiconia intermedia TaxID=763267 RepID=A0A0H3VLE2_9HEMI|nr:NADH dehydrogenase subunit 6 [Rubiconia intermedia]
MFILSAMMTLSLTLMFLNHPLSMGLILILQTIMTSMIIGYMLTSFLFSYILIIIMLSGALVLFIYMASLASNEKFKVSTNMAVMSLLMLMIMMIMNYNNKIYPLNSLQYEETASLIKIFNTMTSQITIMAIIYLLLTMIVVSNVAKVNQGPLRMKNN